MVSIRARVLFSSVVRSAALPCRQSGSRHLDDHTDRPISTKYNILSAEEEKFAQLGACLRFMSGGFSYKGSGNVGRAAEKPAAAFTGTSKDRRALCMQYATVSRSSFQSESGC